MLNKKLLAASIAATLSTSALAVIDLNATAGFSPLKYADELIDSTKATYAIADAAAVTEVQTVVGFAVSSGVKRYVRVDLANANFGATAPDLTLTTAAAASTETVTLLAGGTEDSAYAIFEISSDAAIVQTDTAVFDFPSLKASTSADVAMTYRLYEELTPAANEGASLYTDAGNTIITTASAFKASVIAAGASPEATVASGFENFTTSLAVDGGVDEASVGSFDFAGALASDVLDPTDSTAVTVGDVFDATYTATVTGDVSFGDWFLSLNSDCSSKDVDLVEATAGTSATSAAIANSVAKHYVCVEVANDSSDELIVNKGSYSLELEGSAGDVIMGNLADIAYDTVSIEVPYLTTFSNYNQRIYMVNRSSNDVYYTMSFTTEGVATATPGAKATGTIPAGEMLAVRADEVVTLSGRTRTAATIELEAIAGQVDVTTQTVNLTDGTTDTVKLN